MELNFNNIRIAQKSDTAENWKINNPILRSGEMGFENNTYKMKTGDGITRWRDLPYLNFTEVTGVVIDNQTGSGYTLCTLPNGFIINEIIVTIEEAFTPDVQLQIGFDYDEPLITNFNDASEPNILLTDAGCEFYYRINKTLSKPSGLKVWRRRNLDFELVGKLNIKIK